MALMIDGDHIFHTVFLKQVFLFHHDILWQIVVPRAFLTTATAAMEIKGIVERFIWRACLKKVPS